jgi:uncharacterized protein YjbI with pentapeptide repeats
MQTIEVNQENFSSVNWEDDYFKFSQFTDISTDGGHVTSDFANCTFENVDWYWGIFNVVNFVECRFVNCIFRGTSFPDCKFVVCEFVNTQFIGDNLSGRGCDFEGSKAYNCRESNTQGFNASKPV